MIEIVFTIGIGVMIYTLIKIIKISNKIEEILDQELSKKEH